MFACVTLIRIIGTLYPLYRYPLSAAPRRRQHYNLLSVDGRTCFRRSELPDGVIKAWACAGLSTLDQDWKSAGLPWNASHPAAPLSLSDALHPAAAAGPEGNRPPLRPFVEPAAAAPVVARPVAPAGKRKRRSARPSTAAAAAAMIPPQPPPAGGRAAGAVTASGRKQSAAARAMRVARTDGAEVGGDGASPASGESESGEERSRRICEMCG
jgi:hypothetical protein